MRIFASQYSKLHSQLQPQLRQQSLDFSKVVGIVILNRIGNAPVELYRRIESWNL
jgi:hypothetical protein